MKKESRTKLFYHVWRDEIAGYRQTCLTVLVSGFSAIDERIGRCVGNEDGYESQDAADKVRAELVDVRGRGYTHVVERLTRGPRVTLRWQHYREGDGETPTEYCGVQIDAGVHYHEITRGVRLFERICDAAVRRHSQGDGTSCRRRDRGDWLLPTPQAAVEALRAMRGSQVYANEKVGAFGCLSVFNPGEPATK